MSSRVPCFNPKSKAGSHHTAPAATTHRAAAQSHLPNTAPLLPRACGGGAERSEAEGARPVPCFDPKGKAGSHHTVPTATTRRAAPQSRLPNTPPRLPHACGGGAERSEAEGAHRVPCFDPKSKAGSHHTAPAATTHHAAAQSHLPNTPPLLPHACGGGAERSEAEGAQTSTPGALLTRS